MNLLLKLIFYLKKPKIIVILGQKSSDISILTSLVLGRQLEEISFSPKDSDIFKIIRNDILIIKNNGMLDNFAEMKFLIKESSFPVLIFGQKEIDKNKKLQPLIASFFKRGEIVTDFEGIRQIKEIDGHEEANIVSVGLEDNADLWISDLNTGEETNFKINHGGDVVPFWIDKKLTRDEITNILLAIGGGMGVDFNLIQISQNLKI